MAVADPIWGNFGPKDVEPSTPLLASPARMTPAHLIKPRQWLYGTMLLRGFMSVCVAPGGVGKTALGIGIGITCAHGKKLLGDWVHQPLNVLICTLEDPEEELDRRIAAFMMRHKLTHLTGKIHVIAGRDRRLNMASVDGDRIVYPDKAAITETILEHDIGLTIVDPYVKSHRLEENSNMDMDAASTAWSEVAHDTDSSGLLIHHTRKGAVAGDIESARGGKALTDAARSALTLAAMTDEEADGFNVPRAERRLYIRMDDAKANMSPPAANARWLKLDSVNLGNGTSDYPNGDNVQAVVLWEPPSIWATISTALANKILDQIGAGKAGVPYAPTNRGGGTRWAGSVVMAETSASETQAWQVIKTWIDNGVLVSTTFHDKANRRQAPCVTVCDEKRPS